MNHRRQRGWTLAETLVAAAIVAVLCATLGLLLAPAVKAQAMGTRVKSDLKQIAVGVNLYLADNDGGFPPHYFRRDLPTLPHYCEGCSRYSPVVSKQAEMLSPTVKNPYIYKWPIGNWRIEQNVKSQLHYHYDPNTFPIFDAPWFQRPLGKVQVEFFSAPGQFQPVVQDMTLVPAVRLDGSLYWKRYWENWQFELAASVNYMYVSSGNGPRNKL